MYIENLTDRQISELMLCFTNNNPFENIDILRQENNILVQIEYNRMDEQYNLRDYIVEVFD